MLWDDYIAPFTGISHENVSENYKIEKIPMIMQKDDMQLYKYLTA